MAFPSIAGTATTTTAASTTHVLNLPTSIASGNLLLMFVYQNGSDAGFQFTWPAGWTELVDDGGLPKFGIAYRIADGGEGSTISLTSVGSNEASSVCLRITGWHGTTPPEVSTINSETTTTPNPNSLTPSGWGAEDTLWLAALSADFDSGSDAINAFPASYTEAASSVAASIGVISVAYREVNATSEDPGTFTLAVSQQAKTATLAVRPDATPDTTPPTLSSPAGAATGATTASGSVSTDEGNGTLYAVVTTSATAPSVAQVQAGQDHTGAAAAFSTNQAVSASGTQNITGGATGLSASTTYYWHYQQEDTATNDSTVVSSASFTTSAIPTISLTDAFHNGSTLLASETGITCYVLDPSDASLVATVSSLTTDASGVLDDIQHASMSTSTSYWVIVKFSGGNIALVRNAATGA